MPVSATRGRPAPRDDGRPAERAPRAADGDARAPLKLLFFVEGFTDIRFVTGLSEIAELTMVVPARHYAESGLDRRVRESGAQLAVVQIPGGRLAFQARSFAWLWSHARDFDVILAQEAQRGALNATLIGTLRGVPVVTYVGIEALEYYRWRRRRGQIGRAAALAGEFVIWSLLRINGRLATRTLAMGPYLRDVVARYARRADVVRYYGVDTQLYRPVPDAERAQIRRRLQLPDDKFVIFLSSRISHEKDPETVLRAVAAVRERGLDAVVMNLGGGYQEFIDLGRKLGLPESDQWVLGRPAAHPMKDLADYYRAADLLLQASLAEGCGFSPLEALASGTPVVATSVGGLKVNLPGVARLVPPRDPEAMAEQILWVAAHRAEAREEALRGRELVKREWTRERAFGELRDILLDLRDAVAERG